MKGGNEMLIMDLKGETGNYASRDESWFPDINYIIINWFQFELKKYFSMLKV